jgi:tetratricopeptide (TPR) repeat protein
MSTFVLRVLSLIARAAEGFRFYSFAIGFWRNILRFVPHDFDVQLKYNEALLLVSNYKDAEAGFLKMIDDWPNRTEPLISMAFIHKENRESYKAVMLSEKALNLQPDKLILRTEYIWSLISILDYEQAELLYNETAPHTDDPMFLSIKADIHSSRCEWSSMKDCFDSLCIRYPDHQLLAAKKGQMYFMAAKKSNSLEFMFEAEKTYKKLLESNHVKSRYRVVLAEILIALHKAEEAVSIINSISWLSHGNKNVMKLYAWRRNYYNDVGGAKKIWNRINKYHLKNRVMDFRSDLELKSKNDINVETDGIILFTVIKNELWRLSWFLDYYRALGVDHFVIIDNDSTDGTEDFLLLQKDVSLFHTQASYGKAYAGIFWINALVEQFAKNHWCLYVDVDEALVFPCDKELGLKYLTNYMDQKGQEALPAFMLDMHAKSNDCPAAPDSCDFKNDYPYFMNDYTFWDGVVCPYRMVSGGIRSVYHICTDMQKTPLIRGGRGIMFIRSSHTITPAHLTDVTAVLLHYKMAGDFQTHSKKAAMGNRGPGCRARHQTYSRVAKELGSNYSFINEKTVRYDTSCQLIELGLIIQPDDYI